MIKTGLLVFLLCLSAPRAAVLFQENFEDVNFSARGWYDSPAATLSTQQHVAGASCFECFFRTGAQKCAGGTPGRRQFAETGTVFLSFWVKYSANYVGSGRPYHPHLFHFVTNKDDRWVGPSYTHLTTYTEQVGGVVRIALQDGHNNDTNCILLNNNSFVRCNGNYSTYQFTEARSVCACNGLVGDLDGRDCFNQGDGTYYSARYWDSPDTMFKNVAGPFYKNDWHFIECYFQMNSISGGLGVPDGLIQYWYDDSLIMDLRHILFRTGVNPDMRFNQFIVAPYIGDGSPVDQYMWIDDLTVATARPPSRIEGWPRVFPAPAERGFTVKVVDIRGRVVWRQSFGPGTNYADFRLPARLGTGLYFVLLRQPGHNQVRKMAVIR